MTDSLLLDLVEWIAKEERRYSDVMDTWRTSCPRLTIWEDAIDRGLVERKPRQEGGAFVVVTPSGAKFLRQHGRAQPSRAL